MSLGEREENKADCLEKTGKRSVTEKKIN